MVGAAPGAGLVSLRALALALALALAHPREPRRGGNAVAGWVAATGRSRPILLVLRRKGQAWLWQHRTTDEAELKLDATFRAGCCWEPGSSECASIPRFQKERSENVALSHHAFGSLEPKDPPPPSMAFFLIPLDCGLCAGAGGPSRGRFHRLFSRKGDEEGGRAALRCSPAPP